MSVIAIGLVLTRGLEDGVEGGVVRCDQARRAPPRKRPKRTSPRLDPFKIAIDGMLRSDLDAPKKQRHTARRVLLVDEHGADGLSYSTVRDYVAKRRPEILAESGRALTEAFVPQTHLPGAEAEVDFADLWVVLRGVKTKTFLFTMRLSHSGKAAHRTFATQGQEAFLEGHVHAFEQFGGATAASFAATALGGPGFVSCTPGGIMRLLQAYDIDPSGQRAVVIGRSPILGKRAAITRQDPRNCWSAFRTSVTCSRRGSYSIYTRLYPWCAGGFGGPEGYSASADHWWCHDQVLEVDSE